MLYGQTLTVQGVIEIQIFKYKGWTVDNQQHRRAPSTPTSPKCSL
jgi:hypothetical protein